MCFVHGLKMSMGFGHYRHFFFSHFFQLVNSVTFRHLRYNEKLLCERNSNNLIPIFWGLCICLCSCSEDVHAVWALSSNYFLSYFVQWLARILKVSTLQVYKAILISRERISMTLIRCAGWSAAWLFACYKTRFSRAKAHILNTCLVLMPS